MAGGGKRRRTPVRRVSRWFAVGCGAYLGLAYFAAPEFWSLRERGLHVSEMVTRTAQGIPGDPVNVGLVGGGPDIIRAFGLAGWDTADAVTLRTAIDIGESVLFGHPYPDAPVSRLLFEGRPQDFAFEKPVGDRADQRHHVRLWKTDRTGDGGRPLWLGSASFDRGVGLSHDTGAITHHIGPDIDAERAFLFRGFAAAGLLVSTSETAGVGATTAGRNGEGDPYVTDGLAEIGVLKPAFP